MRNPIVYAGGTFDLFHAGHVRFLQACAAHGRVMVGIEDKPGTIISLPDRISVVRACRYVTKVHLGDSPALIEKIRPDYLAHGDDWSGETFLRKLRVDDAWLEEHGIELLYVQPMPGISTSGIIERIKSR
jgi:glycerol-3-phosphate cytidylyltransferase